MGSIARGSQHGGGYTFDSHRHKRLSLFSEIGEEEMSVRTVVLERVSIGYQEGISLK